MYKSKDLPSQVANAMYFEGVLRFTKCIISVLPTLVGGGYPRPPFRRARPVLSATPRPPLILPVYMYIRI